MFEFLIVGLMTGIWVRVFGGFYLLLRMLDRIREQLGVLVVCAHQREEISRVIAEIDPLMIEAAVRRARGEE